MLIETSLPAVPASVPEARRLLEELDGRIGDVAMRNALLLTTELVTNVVRHVGDGDVGLRAELDGDVLRVEVADGGDGFEPGPLPKERARESGWGLHLIQKASIRWGTVHDDDGFTVWFELAV